jgi:cytochrome P450
MARIVDDVISARRDGAGTGADDLLDLMLNATHPTTGRRLDSDNIRQQVITFIVAGHETRMSWPAPKRKSTGCGARLMIPNRHTAMSRSSTAPGYLRVARNDTVLGGRYRIKKGQWVLVVLPLVQRDPQVWPDPERFDPDRFVPGQAKNRAHAYKPFGTCQRACVGRQLALHEAVLTLGMILHRYDLVPQKDYRLRISESITLKPSGFRLGLRRRTASSRRQEDDVELIRRSA